MFLSKWWQTRPIEDAYGKAYADFLAAQALQELETAFQRAYEDGQKLRKTDAS